MKLIEQDENSFTFQLAKEERDYFVAILLRYPVLAPGHFRRRHPAAAEEAGADDDLLREALAEQHLESRRRLGQWLKSEGRFVANEHGFAFKLAVTEVEWLLQVLNNIRVGSWAGLGEPGLATIFPGDLSDEKIQLLWSLEVAGIFQQRLLTVTQPPE